MLLICSNLLYKLLFISKNWEYSTKENDPPKVVFNPLRFSVRVISAVMPTTRRRFLHQWRLRPRHPCQWSGRRVRAARWWLPRRPTSARARPALVGAQVSGTQTVPDTGFAALTAVLTFVMLEKPGDESLVWHFVLPLSYWDCIITQNWMLKTIGEILVKKDVSKHI